MSSWNEGNGHHLVSYISFKTSYLQLLPPPAKPLLRITFTFAGRPRVLSHDDVAPDGKLLPRLTLSNNDEVYEEDGEDLINQVDQIHGTLSLLDKPREITMEEKKSRSKDPHYQFCPLEHRLPILRLIAKAHALHPLLPERHGALCTAGQIYRDSVLEMYTHCKRNDLREVWAYMWNSWYNPSKWTLWAHSAYEVAIPRKRTTMIVEAVWKNLKRITLYRNNRPRMDFVIHLIATESIPSYHVGFANVRKQTRHSRPHNLTAEQRSFKKAWIRLSQKPINGQYSVNSQSWTCTCGAQKYHTHLLCKHLVQSIPMPPDNWWPYAIRSQTQPFYTIPTTPPYIPPTEQLHTPYHWLL